MVFRFVASRDSDLSKACGRAIAGMVAAALIAVDGPAKQVVCGQVRRAFRRPFPFFLEVFVGIFAAIFVAMLRTGHPAGMYTRALAPAGYDMRAGAFCIDD